MFNSTKVKFADKWFSKFLMAALAVSVFAFASLAVSAQNHPTSCPLTITNVTGDLANFTVTNTDGSTVSISIPVNTVGVWGTVSVGTSPNANVTVSAIPSGTKNAVTVTATKIDLNLPASFSLVAMDSVGHNVTINATVNCTPVTGCTRTQGYWKNKPNAWTVDSLMLGNTTYTQEQLISILKTPTRGNGLVSLSHQLIAAKLNAASGTTVPTSVANAIAQADALIGNLVVPPVGGGYLPTTSTGALASILDDYNNGNTPGGPPHCD